MNVNTYTLIRNYVQLVPTLKAQTTVGDHTNLSILGQAILTTKQFADGKSHFEFDQDAERERRFFNIGMSLTPTEKNEKDFEVNLYLNHEAKETLVLDDELVNYGDQEKTSYGLNGYYNKVLAEHSSVRFGGELNFASGKVDDDAMIVDAGGQYIAVPTSEMPNPYYAYVDELDIFAIYGELNHHFSDSFSAKAGVRYDAVMGGEGATSPYLELNLSVTDNVSLFASGGQSVRIPSLNEYNAAERPVRTVLYGLFQSVGCTTEHP